MSSHIKYHACQNHAKYHFVSCIGRCDVQQHTRKVVCSIIKESEFTQHVLCPSWYTSQKNFEPVLHSRVDQRPMPYLPDYGIHCSITNCKASQESPYSHVKHPAFYIGPYSVRVSGQHGSQCTRHQYWEVCHDTTHSTTGITSLGRHSNT